jgi:carbon monoxide dehydrogenase subunit G
MAELSVSANAAVSAPPERVWQLLCDTSRYVEWVAGTDEVTRTDGPAERGSTYDEVNPILGPWKAKTRWTVIEFEAPRRQVHRSEGLPLTSSFDVVMEVAPVGDSASEVTITLRGTSSGGPLGSVFTRLMTGQIKRDNEKTVRQFAELAARELGGAQRDRRSREHRTTA